MSQHSDDDLFAFDQEDPGEPSHAAHASWHILIVDDDRDVHPATCLALAKTEILGRPLQFLHAYSAQQALQLLDINLANK